MKAVFIHDHYFVFNKEDGKVYDGSGGVFDFKLWNRYLDIFDELIVVGRETENLPNKLIVSSAEKVSFSLINDLKSGKDRFLKQSIIKEKLKKIILLEVPVLLVILPNQFARKLISLIYLK
jgi:hypothetical protein